MSGVKGMRRPESNGVDEMVRLHVQKGLSTRLIAQKLGMKKNSVLASLRYRGVLRRALGRDIEEEVALWHENQGMTVVRQKGDAPFDLLISGKRIDVKSSSVHFIKGKKTSAYRFDIQHSKSLPKNQELFIDWFYLVLLNGTEKLIYKLRACEVGVKKLSIPESLKTKYPLQFVGELI